MVYKGIARGKTVELDELLPYPEGQLLSVSVEPVEEHAAPGSAAAIRRVMHEAPHLSRKDVVGMEEAIERGKLPLRHESVFDRKEGNT